MKKGNYLKTIIIACFLILLNILFSCTGLQDAVATACLYHIGCTIDTAVDSRTLTGYELGDFVVNPLDDGTYRIIGISEQGNTKDVLVVEENYMGAKISSFYIFTSPFSVGCLSTIQPTCAASNDEKPKLGKRVKIHYDDFKCNAHTIYFKDPVPINDPAGFTDDKTFVFLFDKEKWYRYSDYIIPEYQRYDDKSLLNEDKDTSALPNIEDYGYTLSDGQWLADVIIDDYEPVYPVANVLYYKNYTDKESDSQSAWSKNGYYWIDKVNETQPISYIPENPTREGFTFVGWFTEPECVNEWNFSTIVPHKTKITEKKVDMTFYIHYKVNDDTWRKTHSVEVLAEIEEPDPLRLYAKWVKN